MLLLGAVSLRRSFVQSLWKSVPSDYAYGYFKQKISGWLVR
jgi:hypothetical protein